MQDCSTFQSEDLGIGIDYLKKHHDSISNFGSMGYPSTCSVETFLGIFFSVSYNTQIYGDWIHPYVITQSDKYIVCLNETEEKTFAVIEFSKSAH